MIQSLRVTLYEVFGYLLPGALVLVGLVVIGWSCWWPQTAIPFGGYSAFSFGGADPEEELDASDQKNAALLAAVRAGIARHVGVKPEELSTDWLFRILDQRLAVTGCADDRDLFVYREGFYRGTAIGAILLGVAAFIRAAVPGPMLAISGVTIEVPRIAIASIGVIAVVYGYLSVLRWRRFGRYRTEIPIATYLADLTTTNGEDESESAERG
jgi:hypothetical protein